MKQRPELVRSVPLIDIEIERGGDGRTVTAYAATFGDPYEVIDMDGHYDEIINRAAFNAELGRGFGHVRVLFNHGRTISGTPSSDFSMPIAVPLEVRAEARGLLTRSRYLEDPLADRVLEQIRSGGVTAQSFRGPIYRSARPVAGPNGRPVIERLALGLIEYGPAVFATNDSAQFLAVRSQLLEERFGDLDDLTEEERAELVRRLNPQSPADDAQTPVVDGSEGSDAQEEEEAAARAAAEAAGSSTDLLAAEAANRRRRLQTETNK